MTTSRNALGSYLVDLATRIAGEDIANDWLKIKMAAPATGLVYRLADLFTSTNVVTHDWNYGTVVSCAGYSKIFGWVDVNTPNSGTYQAFFRIGIDTNLSSRPTVRTDAAVVDSVQFVFDNKDTNGILHIGQWMKIDLYNNDTNDATIIGAEVYLLP